jgi:hypothetical protein
MRPPTTLRRFAPAALLVAALGAAPSASAAESPEVEKALAAVKAAHDKYKDPAAAVADGWVATDECYVTPDGVMGYHYVNEKRMATGTKESAPPILVYQPDGKGGRMLVAVEWFQVDADQDLKTTDDHPSLFGRKFDGPMEGHTPGMPRHYDLHAWLYQTNPAGVFVASNKAGSCAGHKAILHEGHDQVGKVPAGGVEAGGVRPTGTDETWLLALGVAAVAAGGLTIARGTKLARRRG